MTHIQKREILNLRGQGLGYAQIAEAVGLPKNTVKTFCWRNQQQPDQPIAVIAPAPVPKPIAVMPEGNCPNCGSAIAQVPRQKPRRFCCEQCRRAWWNAHRDELRHRTDHSSICLYCGKSYDNRGRYQAPVL
jgi:endogenous inhibitor of DNA gyrase (YacG/DUF329 family)